MPVPPSVTASGAPVAVLDSNIWVDILVFDDPVSRPIRAALEQGRLRAPIDAACREELRRVLGYPQFAHRQVDEVQAMAWLDSHTETHVPGAPPQTAPRPLPVWKDRDDQKFIELARDAGAGYLVSKDRAVLKLAGRLKHFGMLVLKPEAFVKLLGEMEPG
ncbi:MAG: PIN domain-containing protein [Candidatus Protistobacter heckmanni]|nr:PIN domain-containing protein [Candidatus Protistobacter heckmanni]